MVIYLTQAMQSAILSPATSPTASTALLITHVPDASNITSTTTHHVQWVRVSYANMALLVHYHPIASTNVRR